MLVSKSLSCELYENGMEGKDEVLLSEIGTFVCFLSSSLLFLRCLLWLWNCQMKGTVNVIM